jgi:uncharacterized protein (DUF952 family)
VRIYHIATAADWQAAQESGTYTTSTRGLTLEEQGFIHASRSDQWEGVRAAFYADVTEPLVLLEIDTDRLDVPVVEETSEPDAAETFPHVYGALRTEAVVGAHPLDGRDDDVPFVAQVVLDCADPRELAEFYRRLLGYAYRPGDEPPPDGEPDPRGEDWLVLRPDPSEWRSGRGLAFQATDAFVEPSWSAEGPVSGQQQMLHLDMTVPDVVALARQRDRATALGARILLDRSGDEEEPLYVFADPAGHPFCIFVA